MSKENEVKNIPEKQVPEVKNLTNKDFFRIITEQGDTRKVEVGVVKDAILKGGTLNVYKDSGHSHYAKRIAQINEFGGYATDSMRISHAGFGVIAELLLHITYRVSSRDIICESLFLKKTISDVKPTLRVLIANNDVYITGTYPSVYEAVNCMTIGGTLLSPVADETAYLVSNITPTLTIVVL